MTLTPPHIQDASKRKIRKFLRRSAPGLGQPIVELRDDSGAVPVLDLTWERVDDIGWRITDLHHRTLDKRMVDSTIVECRVFFTESEDCYLPGIVKSLQSLLTQEQARARRALRDHVAQVVTGQRIGASGPVFSSGRLEMDNGFGPGILIGSDEIAMDYIYGEALHEDDDRIARLANVNPESVLRAVIYHFNDLLHVVSNVRGQIEHDLQQGYFTLDTR